MGEVDVFMLCTELLFRRGCMGVGRCWRVSGRMRVWWYALDEAIQGKSDWCCWVDVNDWVCDGLWRAVVLEAQDLSTSQKWQVPSWPKTHPGTKKSVRRRENTHNVDPFFVSKWRWFPIQCVTYIFFKLRIMTRQKKTPDNRTNQVNRILWLPLVRIRYSNESARVCEKQNKRDRWEHEFVKWMKSVMACRSLLSVRPTVVDDADKREKRNFFSYFFECLFSLFGNS